MHGHVQVSSENLSYRGDHYTRGEEREPPKQDRQCAVDKETDLLVGEARTLIKHKENTGQTTRACGHSAKYFQHASEDHAPRGNPVSIPVSLDDGIGRHCVLVLG